MGISKRSLQRRLQQQGTSYRELIGRARFDLACHLLRDSGLRVLNVAHALGYEDSSNFGRAFRQIAGMGPIEFRRTLRTTGSDFGHCWHYTGIPYNADYENREVR